MKISVQQGLNELKLLDSRINRAITELGDETYLLLVNNGNELANDKNADVNKKKEHAKGLVQSVLDLIERRREIKQAIVLSNANTKVTIGGREYTVAEAIEFKDNSIQYAEHLSSYLRIALNEAKSKVLTRNTALENDYKKQIEVLLGSDTNKDGSKDVLALLENKLNKEKVQIASYDVIVDGKRVDVQDLPSEIFDTTETFLAEIDLALTTSNVTTFIEVSE